MPLHKTLYAYAFSILHNENDAADCLQDALSRLWENRDRLDKVENVTAYAIVTVRHVAISLASHSRREVSDISVHPPDFSGSNPTPEDIMEGKDNLRTMSDIIRQLPENQRKIVMMSAVAGLSNSEITEATGLSDSNVRVLLSRGRKKLKQLFSKY